MFRTNIIQNYENYCQQITMPSINLVRFFVKKRIFNFSSKINLVFSNTPRVLMADSAKMTKSKVLVTRPDIPITGLNLLREQ